MNTELHTALAHWSYIAPLLTPPRDEAGYLALQAALDGVLDAGGADEHHPLASLAHLMGELIAEWEDRHRPMPPDATTPQSRLAYLMARHGLRQSEIPEVGNQAKISEILTGKRKINLRQAKALAFRFGLPLETFAA
jgi:HTH-type transcriptional regulator/antitoxin HigA